MLFFCSYMMLIERHGEVYMLDRDNQVFQVENLTFWKRKQLENPLNNTLVDGEMVVDHVEGKPVPRYLIYDVMQVEVGLVKFLCMFTTCMIMYIYISV